MKKILYLVVFTMTMTICTSVYAKQYPLSIRESNVIKENTDKMLGANSEWESRYAEFLNDDMTVKKDYADVMSNYTLTMSRMAGSSSRVFQWKGAVGPYENRPMQFNGYIDVKMFYGVLEWIKHVKTINNNVGLTYCLNMETESSTDAADLAEFLYGDGSTNYNGGTNWAKKRQSYGVQEPVKIDIWELGNEIDAPTVLGPQGMTKEEYVIKAKEYIKKIKAIDPNAVFAACGHTDTPHNSKEAQDWNRYVLQQLGNQIDYLTVHLYYTQYDMVKYQNAYMDSLKNLIDELCPNVKLYYSEHSTYIKDFNDKEIRERTHAMYGTLATSEFFNRVMIRPEVYAADYHSLYSPKNWTEYYVNGEGKIKPTPISNMLKFYEEYSIGNVVDSTLENYKNGTSAGVTSMTVTKNGYLNIIITNQTSERADIPFTAEKDYIITERSEIYADTSIPKPEYADNWYDADTGIEKHEVFSGKEYYKNDELCTEFSVKPYSVTAIKLKSVEPINSKIYVAKYDSSHKLKGVRIIEEYQFTTNSKAMIDIGLKPGEWAYVWDADMKVITEVLTLDKLPGNNDNDIKDGWDII